MKLLFDQNISFRLINKIITLFPEAKQVRQLGIENYSDIEIWDYAKQNDYNIITFDADFLDISNLKGHPPKIIWLRFGNTSTDILAEILMAKYETIKEFITSGQYSEFACLELK
jgi:predicted nuclease of predicted toxin-antitoxin system